MKISTGAKLSQEAAPFRRINNSVKRRQKGMIQHFQNLPFGLGPPFLVPAGELLLIHDLGRKESVGRGLFELGEVDGADVAGAEAVEEAEVGEGGDAAEGVGGFGVGGGGGGPVGAGAGGAVDVGGGGGGVEAHAF